MAPSPMRSGKSNTSATKTFGADGDEVFVWELVGLLLVHFRGRFVHCVVIRAEAAQLPTRENPQPQRLNLD